MLTLEFFVNLPSEVVIEILSRLPVRAVFICKCVCKSWLQFIETREFVKSHLAKSDPGLVIFQQDNWSYMYKFLEFVDGIDFEDHDLHYNPVANFDLPYAGWLYGSTDGLLFQCELSGSETNPDALFICNPITREYINLDSPQEFAYTYLQVITYGFGSSVRSGEYKVVRVSHDRLFNQETLKWHVTSEAECHVYTLGTAAWRRSASCGLLEYLDHISGIFSNGSLHWVVRDSNIRIWISCFDLETESFTTFAPPRFLGDGGTIKFAELTLFARGDRLGLCHNTAYDIIFIWSMKLEDGAGRSWRKEFVISRVIVDVANIEGLSSIFYPIKIFQDGDILFAWKDFSVIYYSRKNRTIQEVERFKVPPENMIDAVLHTPSFLSPKIFGFENVISF